MPRKALGVRECPKDLKFFILLANLLPLEKDLPDLLGCVRKKNEKVKEILDKKRRETKGRFGEVMKNITSLTFFYDLAVEGAFPDTPITIRKLLSRYLRQFPSDFIDVLFTLAKCDKSILDNIAQADFQDIGRIIGTYDFIRSSRQSITEFIFRLEYYRYLVSIGEGGLSDHYFPFSSQVLISKDSDGKLVLAGFASLIGTFDADHLRLCKICKKIYWAKRRDSKTCGEKKCVDGYQNNEKRQKRMEAYGTL